MTAAVLTKAYVAVDEERLDLGKLRDSHAFLAETLIDRRSRGGSQEHALGIYPAVALGGSTGADKDRSGSAESNQFVRVHR